MKSTQEPEEGGLTALAKLEDLYKYMQNALLGRKVPVVLKYSVGETILKSLAEIGGDIAAANSMKQWKSTEYKAKQLIAKAQEEFLKTEFMIRLFISDDRIEIKREHVFRLETELKNTLGGWAKYVTSQGRR